MRSDASCDVRSSAARTVQRCPPDGEQHLVALEPAISDAERVGTNRVGAMPLAEHRGEFPGPVESSSVPGGTAHRPGSRVVSSCT